MQPSNHQSESFVEIQHEDFASSGNSEKSELQMGLLLLTPILTIHFALFAIYFK